MYREKVEATKNSTFEIKHVSYIWKKYFH